MFTDLSESYFGIQGIDTNLSVETKSPYNAGIVLPH